MTEEPVEPSRRTEKSALPDVIILSQRQDNFWAGVRRVLALASCRFRQVRQGRRRDIGLGGAGSQTATYLHHFNDLITYCCLGELLSAG